MTPASGKSQGDLFTDPPDRRPGREDLGEGISLLHGLAAADAGHLVEAVDRVAAAAPFRHMATPGGYSMSVAMTSCGTAGWISDRTGYRYSPRDPMTDRPWPAMPRLFLDLAARAAAAGGFPGFTPDSCLVNRYAPGTRLSLHQDKDERDFTAPIVSISLGLPALFLLGGIRRRDRPRRIPLESGDIVVWGGPARRIYHGIAPVAGGDHPLTGRTRVNLTFRKAL